MTSHDKANHLPLLKSPLVDETGSTGQLTSYVSSRQQHEHVEGKDSSKISAERRADHGNSIQSHPVFRRYAEATHSELFYDLFFVAILTVFTNVHEVNDSTTLKQYIGFFAVLWLTWYQVSLYDVRFSVDSVLDRIAKAMQFGVMIGFAVVGPQFNVGSSNRQLPSVLPPSWKSFRALSVILMVSRLVLVWQYVQALLFARRYKNTRLPLGAVAATYAVSAFTYLGLLFTFTQDRPNNAYIAWYIIALAETIIATTISSHWRVISFKGTHLVQRMGLLTLIFLGEGVMGATGRIQLIFTSAVLGYSAINVGNTISLVLSLYFLYMLYFDWVEDKHFGTIRQQIWAFLHFPLHLALVVAVEGGAQVLTWTAAITSANSLSDSFSAVPIFNGTQSATTDAIDGLKIIATNVMTEGFKQIGLQRLDEWANQRVLINDGFSIMGNITESEGDRLEALVNVFTILTNMIFSIGRFNPPQKQRATGDAIQNALDSSVTADLLDQGTRIFQVFILTFVYFFISLGLVVMLIGIIAMLSKTEKKTLHWIRLVANLVVGAGLCCVAAMAAGSTGTNETLFDNYAASPWILPTVVLALFAAVLLNNVEICHRPGRRRREV